MNSVKIFQYIQELDSFIVTDKYRKIAEYLNLTEWNPVVWIGRLFILDNDYGEHWFDNWNLREQKKADAERLGIPCDELMIIDPERFKDDRDGPCHNPELRKQFWTDVLKSLELSYDLLFEEARMMNEGIKDILPDEYLIALEARIAELRTKNESE
jgi:hypothetical protein